ncbi:hypothetical protein, partial [uncultured Faecalibaculum sp.]|uniref:hypothetical protein n=1 Tax=uncultured Faecalibaculum sp. TaxID=1729681 RepID=UPI00272E070E
AAGFGRSSGILFGQAKLLNVLNRRIRIRMYGGVRGRGSTNLFLSTRLNTLFRLSSKAGMSLAGD